jgi:hypothetical protein
MSSRRTAPASRESKPMIGCRDLREMVFHQSGGFADEFAHISEGRGRVRDLALSICSALVAEACNISLETLVRPEVPALTAARALCSPPKIKMI